MNLNDVAENGIFCDGDWIEKKDQDPNGDVRLIQLADIGDGFFKDVSNRYITSEKAKELNCTYLEKGDILIARLPEPLGRACIFPLEGKYITAVDIAVVRVVRDDIEPKYLMNLINSVGFRAEIKKYESGTTRKRISRKNLGKIEFSIPDIGEQRKKIEKLEETMSSLDNAVETLNKTKEQLAVYRQAVLREAFSNIKHYEIIRNVSRFVTSGSRGWAKYYADKGALFIRIGNLTRTAIDINLEDRQYVNLPQKAEGKRTRLQPGDVLVSITADLGSIGFVTNKIQEAYVNQHIAMIRFKNPEQGEMYAWFLRSQLGQKDLLKNKRGAGKLGLGLDDIRDSRVPNISDEEAKRIVDSIEERFSVCDSIQLTVDEALQQAEAMRQSILKEAFEGRL
ncbi:restriction endonuclease subunit S [Pseudobutyrivibrio sp.]|uniref:restriction endonuclease subunit S n=1 Tax=Pseudobutyrivibrio sp. TaxID=2014367 RepID=UPI0025D99143|nr:restriction endonuclease subunit S [Pseudobutyrivibrio sp.]